MRAAIDLCAQGVSRGLEAIAEREAAMLRAVAEREAAMILAVQDERVAAQQALTEREAGTSAGRKPLAADRAALDSEIGAMKAAARRQETRVLLNVEGGAV